MTTASQPADEFAARTLAARNQTLLQFRDAALHLAYRMAGNLDDAEDILQNAYLRAVGAAEPLQSAASLKSWFLQITANAARDFFRSEKSRRTRERTVAVENSASTSLSAGASLEQNELRTQVEAELAALDERFRLPIALHYEQGMSYEEAASVLGQPSGTLRVYASQGIKELRERLEVRGGRPMTAEILIALLGAGIALTASPALAASVTSIVASNHAAAPAAAAAAKPLVIVAQGGGSSTFWGGITAAALACAAIFVSVGYAIHERQQNTPASTSDARIQSIVKLGPAPEIPHEHAAPLPPAPDPVPVIAIAPDDAGLPAAAPAFDPPALPPAPPAPAVDFVLTPDAELTWAKADDVMPLIDVPRGTVIGAWQKDGDKLRAHPSDFSRISIPYIPGEEYDFRMDFARIGGADVNMIFPAGGQSCIWKMGSWNSCYFGTYKGNPDVMPIPNFRNGVRHTCIIEVRKNTLTGYIDGKLMKSVEIGKSSVACSPDFRLPDQRTIGLGSWRNEIVFHRVMIRNVTGAGKSLPPDTDAANAVSAEYWANAKNLMPQAVDAKSALGGKWQLTNGELVSDAARNSRYQFNYAPPQEYDFRVVFTRTDGVAEVAQIISAGGRQFVWKMDINGVSVFDSVGGNGRDENPTLLHTPGLCSNGTQHTAVVCVRKDGIKAYVDGRLLSQRATDFTDMNIEEAWKLASPEVIGVGFHASAGIFHSIQIKEISGQGRAVEFPEAQNQNQKEGAF